MDRNSTQTLQEGLEEYYVFNPHITPPSSQPPEFAKILLAHDVSHVIYGCDTGMYDELKILPLFWWTSDCTFQRFCAMRNRNTPAVDVMYDDMTREKGAFWLYGEVLKILPLLIPELISIWFKTRKREKRVPFLEFEPLLDQSLLNIRREFDLLQFIE
ncbi:hypothetical protein [Synechococcus sp. PCC 6312]|uniref:hypothetical protein n=1 Tax=Synechococcus sp. (strain ATCC 27167 / PCC 6312) TaxID=195253 RepID=UPI00029F013A|nr:hypothetical protein [Synechococcus sp. PCC 6312]AFY61211.1 hypothetical protein Syn6312_2090 [Synechococcus sp. PCC 6312]